MVEKTDKLTGGLADKKSIEDIAKTHGVSVADIKNELKLGIPDEMEHTSSEAISKEIALDHLMKDPRFYSKEDKMEKEQLNESAKRMMRLAGLSEGEDKKYLQNETYKQNDYKKLLSESVAPEKMDVNTQLEGDFKIHKFEQTKISKDKNHDELYAIKEGKQVVDLSFLFEKKSPSAGLSKKEKSSIVKKAKAGKDIGKKGKGFKKIKKSAEENGAEDPEAVAAAAMWKNIKRKK